MVRVIYFLSIFFYAGIGILGAVGHKYFEVDGGNRILNNYLLIISIIALAIGLLVFYYFKILFPKGYAKQNEIIRMLIPLLFVFLAFTMTVNVFKFVNSSLGAQKEITVEGFIEQKWQERGGKKMDYFIKMKDTVSGFSYAFEIKSNIYDMVGKKGDRISKVFYRGSLGVIYSHEY